MARRVTLYALLGALVLAAAGCGGSGTKPYTAKGSAACFAKSFTHVTTDPVKVGFIAGFADNGGLRATTSTGNVLTVAFAGDATSALSTEQAFRNHAPARLRPRMNDIMESQANAVLVWTVSPTPTQLAAAEGCLHS
ncbi:MAG TPA: hypothetical protein VMU58_11880 [Gaiellaceae bacterium]|nr:hypothetical protein [Gaiellaceae bacterium]